MCDKGIIGNKSPLQLIRILWLINTKYFNIKGRLAHYKIKISDFLIIKNSNKQLVLQYKSNNISESPTNLTKKNKQLFSIIGQNKLNIFLINCFSFFLSKRPTDIDTFYLTPKACFVFEETWYNKVSMGKNSIGKIMNDIIEKNPAD